MYHPRNPRIGAPKGGCFDQGLFSKKSSSRLGVDFLGPFLAGNCAEKPPIAGANLKGSTEDFRRNGGNIAENRAAENRALTEVNRRHFRICGQFSAVN